MRLAAAEPYRPITMLPMLKAPMIGQVIRYGVAGSTAMVTLLVLLALLVELVGLDKTIASAVAFMLATLLNYSLQHRFVFATTRAHLVALPTYLLVTAMTMSLNVGLFWLLTERLGIYYLLSQMATIAVIVPINFVLNRTVTFRHPTPAAPARSS